MKTLNVESNVMNDLLDPQEAADCLGLTLGALAKWRAERRALPFMKIGGGRVRYKRGDIVRFIESRMVQVADSATA